MTEKEKNWFVFIIGLTAMIKLRILGTFAIAELIAFVSLFFIPIELYKENPTVNKLFKFAFLWLVGVIISDFWNDTSLEDALKGTFNVVFLIALIPFVYWALYDKPQRLMYYYAGFALSALYNFYSQKASDLDFLGFQVWRVYGFYPLAVFVASYLYYKDRHLLSYICIIGFGVWGLFNMSRNVFLNQTLAVVLLLYTNRFNSENIYDRISSYRQNIIQLFIMLIIGFGLIDFTYETLAENGTLGESVHQKYIMQKYAKNGLASGRGDALLSIYAISKNPIIGYGSYAKDKTNFINKHIIATGGIHTRKNNDFIPCHSYILGTWVHTGLLGALFFFFILQYLWHIVKSGLLLYDSEVVGLYMYLLMVALWDILFSPFDNRINLLFFIISLMAFEEKLYFELENKYISYKYE